MYRIDNTSAVTSLPIIPPTGIPGFFTNGNPTLGIQATIVDAWWANMLQEEILAVVNAAGIAPSKTDNGQLLKALHSIFATAGLYLPLAGGTMTGFPLLLARDPVLNMEAATRQFVLAQLGVGQTGFLPLTGGTLHNPGLSDPLVIQADQGQNARITYLVTNTREWGAGCNSAGVYVIRDWTANAGRLTIDTTGLVTVTQGLTIGFASAADPLLTLNAAAGVNAEMFFVNPARSWRLGLRGDNSNFYILDQTAGIERLAIDVGGNVTIDGGQLTIVNAGIISGGDILLNRPQSNSYIARPNIAGQKTLNFAVQGGGPLDTLGLIAAQTTATGAFGANGLITAGAGAHITGLYQGYGLVVDSAVLLSGGATANGQIVAAAGIDVPSGTLSVNNAFVTSTSGGAEVIGGLNVSSGTTTLAGSVNINGADVAMFGPVIQIENNGTPGFSLETPRTGLVNGIWNDGTNLVLGVGDGNGNLVSTLVWMESSGYFHAGRGMLIDTADLNIKTGNAYKPGDGSWGTYGSSRLVKKDIEPYTRGLAAINALRPVTYKYNGLGGLPDNDQTYHGLIIEDMSEIMPELIGDWYAKLRDDDTEETNIHTYSSTAITYALINAVQELMAKVEALEARK
jgi:hypothetical protein